MKTTGDKILHKTLDKIGGKGLFVKELELALREKRVDLTVHSLKDMPMELPEDLPIIGYSKREDPRDVLILPKGATQLAKGLPIGTSSFRRALQLEKLYPGHRGKARSGQCANAPSEVRRGGNMALWSWRRLGQAPGAGGRVARYFTVEEMLPLPARGSLGFRAGRGEGLFVSGGVS